jgi:hypothetical protein
MLPWIDISANPFQRAQQVVNRGKPLTQSYPVGTFYVTAQNGVPPAPGQPSGMRRFMNGRGTGDPRANGGFYNVKASSYLRSLLTGTPPDSVPQTVIGGNNITYGSDNMFLWLGIAGIVAAFFFWNK